MKKRYFNILFLGAALGCSSPPPNGNALEAHMRTSDLIPTPSEKIGTMATDTVSADYLMGRFDPMKDERFVAVAAAHRNGEGMYLRKEAYEGFVKMHNAALKDGVKLKIVSGTRNFNAQKGIWEAKWTGKRAVDGKMLQGEAKDPKERALLIMRWSSMPGTSRHHWGTDMDLNELNNAYFASGTGLKIYQWLTAHAAEYGFCQVYSPLGDERPNGYQEEKWHWSYLPLSKSYTEQYAKLIKDADIKGFIGAEAAVGIGVVEKFVKGISKECQ